MKILLDTHAYLWFISGDYRLSDVARNAIESNTNTKFLSIASLWEISIKYGVGKLTLKSGLNKVLQDHIYDNGLEVVPVKSKELLLLPDLPWIHRDPFDRLIIATAQERDFSIVTSDRFIRQYDVPVVW